MMIMIMIIVMIIVIIIGIVVIIVISMVITATTLVIAFKQGRAAPPTGPRSRHCRRRIPCKCVYIYIYTHVKQGRAADVWPELRAASAGLRPEARTARGNNNNNDNHNHNHNNNHYYYLQIIMIIVRRRSTLADGIGTSDPNPRNSVNWCV